MMWLAARSAIIRFAKASTPEVWSDRMANHQVRISSMTVLEFGLASRTAAEWDRFVAGPPLAILPREPMTAAIEQRAIEIQGELAQRGQHRAPSLADLLIAATAELNDLTVLHLDKDYELIAAITGQPVERLTLADL